jgi:hypothetical protein
MSEHYAADKRPPTRADALRIDCYLLTLLAFSLVELHPHLVVAKWVNACLHAMNCAN